MQKETLILASNNAGKLREMREILEPFGLEVRSQKEAGFTAEVAETGTTFQENAIIKAKAVQEALHCAVLADDSGLMIDALDGAPGVYSHRFAGEQATDEDRCNLVLEKLQGVPDEQRTARFVCAIATLPQTANSIVLQAFARASLEQSRRAKMDSVMTRYLLLGTRQWQR